MRLDNRTHWRNDHILAFVRRVAEVELDAAQRKTMTVRVRYGRRGASTSGHAPYYGRRIQVMVGSDAIDRTDFAHTIAHARCS